MTSVHPRLYRYELLIIYCMLVAGCGTSETTLPFIAV